MRIGLVDVDGRRFPNLALAKISAYHKAKGDEVELVNPLYWDYDLVYQSKIFTFSPEPDRPFQCEVIKGGTGYDIHKTLPDCIDSLQPDYSLYPWIDNRTAYGFLTRGCCNNCHFCVVPVKEGNIRAYMDIDDVTQGGRRTWVTLMDNNILACDHGREQLVKIADKGYHIDLNQGMSARLVTPEVAEVMARIKWINSTIRFAADTPRQIAEVERAMAMIDRECERLGKTPRKYLIYTMIGSDLCENYERLTTFKRFERVRVVAQPFRDFNDPLQKIPQWQKDMAHWANRRELWATCDFKDFQPRKGFTCNQYFDEL